MDKPEHSQKIKVEHPGHKGKEVEIKGSKSIRGQGVRIEGGSGGKHGPVKILSNRGEE